MIQSGLALRFKENYATEVAFAQSLGFEFFQIWFYNGELSVNILNAPKEQYIKDAGFPIILHAVFDIPDYDKYGLELFRLLDFFEHKELIIHPICKAEPITGNTVFSHKSKLNRLWEELNQRGIKLYVENNSVIDGFFNTVEELRVVFDANPDIGLLLDLAHINDYGHLREIVNMRFPECIHIADKRFGIPHEHLPLGRGEMDFELVFREILPGYRGRLILEAVDSLEDIETSKKVMDSLNNHY